MLSSLAGEVVAQFKFTVLLMANGPLRITSGPIDLEAINSTHSLEDQELKVSLGEEKKFLSLEACFLFVVLFLYQDFYMDSNVLVMKILF